MWRSEMDEEKCLKSFEEDYSLLLEAGFVAIKQADEIAARRLFKAAEALYPENSASQIGLGYIELNKLRVSQAAEIFQKIVREHPDHYLAKALLGISFLLTPNKREEGKALIKEAGEKSDDPTIKNLTSVSIEWLKKDLENKPLPATKVSF
jgi:thioredoxin-like negative regulator of GroEL